MTAFTISEPTLEGYRWLDASERIAAKGGESRFIPEQHPERHLVAPFQRWTDIAVARAELMGEIEAHARALRLAVAGTDDATKLAVYREKYAVAAAALAGDAQALARLAPEAAARNESPEQLAGLVKLLGDLWTGAGLAIDAAYQGHKAAVAALDLEGAGSYDPAAGWPPLS